MIDIITTIPVKIKNVSNEEGLEILKLAFKDVAKNKVEANEEDKWKVFDDSPNSYIYFAAKPSKAWIGCVHVVCSEDSEGPITGTAKPNPSGFESFVEGE